MHAHNIPESDLCSWNLETRDSSRSVKLCGGWRADAGMQFSASTAIQEKSHHLKTLNKQQRYFRSIYFSVWGLKCKSDSCASWQDNSFVWLCMGVSITTLYIMFPINQFDERSAQQLSIAQSKKAVRSSGANLTKRPFSNCLRGSVTISRCLRR